MIRVAKPYVPPEVFELLKDCAETGYLTQGKKVAEFEALLTNYLGAEAVAVSSGTAALHLALLALGIGPGDRVAVPDFTFPATANAVEHCGAKTVLVDIELPNMNISEAELRRLSGIRAVVVVHSFGLPASAKLPDGALLVEDAACALGAELDGKKCATLGRAGAISFHPRKILTTCEGGAVVTRDDTLAELVRSLRFHGAEDTGRGLSFRRAGFNYKLSDVHASFGIAQMRVLDQMIAARRVLARKYLELLRDVEEVIPQSYSTAHVYQAFVVLLHKRVDRDALIISMRQRGIEVGIGAHALHCQPYYQEKYRVKTAELPNSYYAYKQALALPLYPGLAVEEQLTVVRELKQAIQECRRW